MSRRAAAGWPAPYCAGAEAGDVFPVLLGAYGCGPNSMIEHLFGDVVEGFPHAVLESDGHGGKDGKHGR